MAVVPKASIIENAKCAYRDILGSDPERMAPKKVEEYCRNIFKDTCIKMNVQGTVQSSPYTDYANHA